MSDSRHRRRTAALIATSLGATILPVLTPGSARAAAPTPAIRLVAAPSAVVDESGAIWSPDARFADGGAVWTSSAPIAGTTNDKVFQPERWGVRGYDVPVPASGAYRVTLNAAEVVFRDPGRRVFSVSAEGARVVTDLDLVRAAGVATAHSVTFTTTVTDGELNLDLAATVDNAKVSSLSIEPVTGTTAVTRVVAGAAPVTDSSGRVWGGDTRLADGGSTWRSSRSIEGTLDDRLFQPERWGASGYTIPVPAAGTYTVILNTAELTFTTAGQRVFSVVAEGQTKVSNLDLVKAAGVNTAYSARFEVAVTDGVLSLSLPASVNHSKVSSIAVDSGSTPAPVVAPPATSTFGSPLTGDPTSPRGGGLGRSSVWSTNIRTAPLASSSAAQAAVLDAQVQRYYEGQAAFNVWQYQGSVNSVPPGQARVDVRWDDCQGKGSVPTGLLGPGGQFSSVPIPSNAIVSSGLDASLSIYQASTDTMWTFWKLAKKADGWHACWGGRIDRVSTSPGWYANGFGTSATGLATEGGLVNIADVRAGSIDHALALNLINTGLWRTWSWPAQRSDGNDSTANALLEGARVRLDPTVNVDALPLHPIAKMIAKAAQTYGFIVTDKAGVVGVTAESGSAVQTMTGANPWDTLLGGTPSYAIMKNFPWSRMQVLPKDYGKP